MVEAEERTYILGMRLEAAYPTNKRVNIAVGNVWRRPGKKKHGGLSIGWTHPRYHVYIEQLLFWSENVPWTYCTVQWGYGHTKLQPGIKSTLDDTTQTTCAVVEEN